MAGEGCSEQASKALARHRAQVVMLSQQAEGEKTMSINRLTNRSARLSTAIEERDESCDKVQPCVASSRVYRHHFLSQVVDVTQSMPGQQKDEFGPYLAILFRAMARRRPRVDASRPEVASDKPGPDGGASQAPTLSGSLDRNGKAVKKI